MVTSLFSDPIKQKILILSSYICVFLIITDPTILAAKPKGSLNPGDIGTGDVLNENEWTYNQPPYPVPGWLRWGATPNTTIQFDLMAWVFGIPDFNWRWKFYESPTMKWSWETMILYFDRKNKFANELYLDDKHLWMQRLGPAGFTKANGTWEFNRDWDLHFSLGLSYSDEFNIASENRPLNRIRRFKSLIDPILAIGLETELNSNWSFHSTLSYGETFLYNENRPRKTQWNYGFHWYPQFNSDSVWLHNLRVEFDAVGTEFIDVKENKTMPIPLVMYAYWQWN